jgi:hypothetical protein
MSVDLVTIVAARDRDLHPSGASKIFHHAGNKPEMDHHISMWSALPNYKTLICIFTAMYEFPYAPNTGNTLNSLHIQIVLM